LRFEVADNAQLARTIIAALNNGGRPALNTTRTRKTDSADDAVAAKKPARTRASLSAAAPAVAAVKPASRRKAPLAAAAPGTTERPRKSGAAKTSAATAGAAKRASPRVAPAKAVVAGAAAPKPAPRRVARTRPAEAAIDLRVRDAVVARLDAMKAHDLKVIDVRGKTSITDFLVIVSGTSTRHVKSMGDEVVVTAKKFGMPPIGIEGEKDAEWMLVDLGDTVVHLMLPRIREFYGLERLWTLAEESRAAAWIA
jgi:ribosome silencing factor RsfS/YbeB/iojap